MISFHELKPKIYLSGAIVIGFFQIIDGITALIGHSGHLARAFSLVEICWLIVSLVFLLAFKRQKLNLLIPSLFIGYSLYGWFVGSYLISMLLPGESLALPTWFIISAIMFGLVYCVSSLYFYWQWYVVKKLH